MKFLLLFSLILSLTIIPALTIDDASAGLVKKSDREKRQNTLELRYQNCLAYDSQSNDCIMWNSLEKTYCYSDYCIVDNPDSGMGATEIKINCKTHDKICEKCTNKDYSFSQKVLYCYAFSTSVNIQKYDLSNLEQNQDSISLGSSQDSTSLGSSQDLVWDSNNKKWVEKSLLKTQKSTPSSFNENSFIKQFLESQEKVKQTLPDVKKPAELPYYEKPKIPKPSAPWWCFWCN